MIGPVASVNRPIDEIPWSYILLSRAFEILGYAYAGYSNCTSCTLFIPSHDLKLTRDSQRCRLVVCLCANDVSRPPSYIVRCSPVGTRHVSLHRHVRIVGTPSIIHRTECRNSHETTRYQEGMDVESSLDPHRQFSLQYVPLRGPKDDLADVFVGSF